MDQVLNVLNSSTMEKQDPDHLRLPVPGVRERRSALFAPARRCSPLTMAHKAPKMSMVAGGGVNTRRNENRIVINVGGVRFETYKSTLKNIPDTRLAWLTESTSANNTDFDPETGEYFFDRHSGVFAMILNYYRTGKLHTPMDVCGPMFEEELAFWGIDEKQMESCCWTTYRTHRDAQETLAELNGGDLESDNEDDDDDIARRFGIEEAAPTQISAWQRLAPKVYAVLDDPNSGVPGKILTYISVAFIMTSIIVMCVETLKECRVAIPSVNVSKNAGVSERLSKSKPHPALIALEMVSTAYFTMEVVSRLIFCPNKKRFLKSPLNIIDILAVVTAYIRYAIIYSLPASKSNQVWLQTLGVPRIFRVLKLTKNFSGLKIVVHTMKASSKELLLLFIVFAIFVVLCGTLAYIAEQIAESDAVVNKFTSMPLGFWWALITMTTVGYGDVVPQTVTGYLVGVICAIIGVLVIALPVPIIVNNFALYYTHAQARMKLPKRRKRILVGAPDALKHDVVEVDSEEDPEGTIRASSPDPSETSVTSQRKGSEDSVMTSVDSGIKAGSNHMEDTPPGITVEFTDDVTDGGSPAKANSMQIERSGFDESSKKGHNGSIKDGRVIRRQSLRPNGHVPKEENGGAAVRKGSVVPGASTGTGTGAAASVSTGVGRRASLRPGGTEPATATASPPSSRTNRRQSLMPSSRRVSAVDS